ncbi:MAG TPA: hypothetical protein VJN94_12130 [Candidatus Binataceae bacterium]|nr:hypothetical protein [Candidatus Binataceae bacterium]
MGKSTIAGSFQLHGYGSVCDDCLVLRESPGGIIATPGYPGLRLWQDSLEALGANVKDADPVAEYSSKFRLHGAETARRFVAEAQPLRRLYLLSRFEEPEVTAPRLEPMTAAEVFPELIRASFPLDISDKAMLTRHFRLFSRLASQVPARRLTVPNHFAALEDVRRAVLADFEH